MPVKVYQSFHDLPSTFADRNRYPAQQNFFLSNEWFANLYENVLCKELDLRVYVVSGHEFEGALFCGNLRRERKLVSLTNYYSLEYAPILIGERSDGQSVINKLVDYISHEKPGWESVELRFLRRDSKHYPVLMDSFRNAGFYIHEYFQYENWYYPLNGKNFFAYYEERPSKLKNTIKRKSNQLRRNHKFGINVYTSDADHLEAGIDEYTKVYNNSWKHSEPYANFIPALMTLCAKQEVLFLGILDLDLMPVAAQLWLKTVDKFIIYKLCHDEKFEHLSVGSVLSKNMFEEAFKTHELSEIDYGLGSETYKRDWMSHSRLIGGVAAYNKKTLRGFLATLSGHLKAWLKKLNPAWFARR